MVPSPLHPPTVKRKTIDPIDPIDFVDPVALVDVLIDIVVGQKRPTWTRQTLQEVERHVAPHGTFRESKRP
jgi:hypothetical protein